MRGRTHKYVLPQNYPLNQYFNHVFRKICHALKKAAICGSETLVCSQQIRTALPPRTTSSSTAKSRKPQTRNQPRLVSPRGTDILSSRAIRYPYSDVTSIRYATGMYVLHKYPPRCNGINGLLVKPPTQPIFD